MSAPGAKVAVNRDSTYSSTSLHNQITSALIANGSIPAIQTSLLTELQASGWTTNLRNFVTQLMRSGECTKYDELMDRVLDEAMKGMVPDRKANGVNGKATAGGSSLALPESAVREGIKTVRKELDKICEVESK